MKLGQECWGTHLRHGFVGVAACPARIPYAETGVAKASPGGEAGSPQGLTDEVEAKTITMSWYYAVTFDLIRHAIRRDTFPSRGRLWTVQTITPCFCPTFNC